MAEEILKVEHLHKSFAQREILRDVSLSVAQSECMAVVGPSGCGKTTLLRIIAGLSAADSGQISINGKTANDPRMLIPPNQRGVALVFQNLALWPHMTALQNVEFMVPCNLRNRKERQAKAAIILNSVHLDNRHRCHPSQLSQGEQQRVALARALASEPKLLLMDEPFSSQDRRLKTEMMELVREINAARQMAILFVTHMPDEVPAIARRVARMRVARRVEILGSEQYCGEAGLFTP